MELTSKQRAYLRSLSNTLEPAFSLGKASLTPEVTDALTEYFGKNELLKVSVLKNCGDDPRELAQIIGERTHSTVVYTIGKKMVFYKPNKDKPKIVLPPAKARKEV
ncbi:MAG: YhbY family RNA-binding protein [Lachnospiraceae bacterium]|nr:YhbY family RNA-binding protein [Lachnospiraceae bacterium]